MHYCCNNIESYLHFFKCIQYIFLSHDLIIKDKESILNEVLVLAPFIHIAHLIKVIKRYKNELKNKTKDPNKQFFFIFRNLTVKENLRTK